MREKYLSARMVETNCVQKESCASANALMDEAGNIKLKNSGQIGDYSKVNNFDLVRLLASLQVAFFHGFGFFKLSVPFLWPLSYFSGVPMFFCVSGYLITMSLERNWNDLKRYTRSRILRIYPALVCCVTICGIIMFSLGAFNGVNILKIAVWYLSNCVAGGAAINPVFLRHFGVGVWNGSLWTIAVELSFYIALPFIFLALKRIRFSIDVFLVVLLFVSFAGFIAANGLNWGDTKEATVVQKVVWFSLPGNLWMFLFGTLAYRFRERLVPLLFEEKVVWWLAWYGLMITVMRLLQHQSDYLPLKVGLLFLQRASLAALVLSAAFSFHSLSDRLLFRNDISYGLYLWHAPLYNFLLELRCWGWSGFLTGLVSAITIAFLSWRFLESRILRLKFAK